jgi:hypothetical protein
LLVSSKLGVFVLAGVGIEYFVRALVRPPHWARRWSVRALTILAAIALLGDVATNTASAYRRSTKLMTTANAYWWRNYLSIAARVKALRDDRFARVLIWASEHDHRLMALPLHTGFGIYRNGYTPARQFRYAPQVVDEETLRALSVRWVVSERRPAIIGFRFVHRSGAFGLYEYTSWNPQRWTLHGAGLVEPIAFTDEHMALRLRGTTANTRITLHVARYPRWQATLNNTIVPIEPGHAPCQTPTHERDYLIEVPVRDGILRIDFVRQPVDRFAPWVTLATLCLIAGATFQRARSVRA